MARNSLAGFYLLQDNSLARLLQENTLEGLYALQKYTLAGFYLLQDNTLASSLPFLDKPPTGY
jgi:hypothetical protein